MKTHFLAVSVALTWLCLPQAVRAETSGTDDADSSKAAVRFQRAVELYREGSYEGALAEFSKAYQISPSYLVLYNIAQAQYALHDFVGAYKSLMQYLSEGGGDIPADRRAQVDEMTARLVGRIANLQISTNVTGADIRIDGVGVGTSPLPGLIPVNVGTRRVSATKAGSPEVVRVLTVAGRENVKVELQIDETTATSTKLAASAVSQFSPLGVKTQAQAAPSRAGLMVGLSTTAALAIGTGVCGFLALGAQKNLKDQVNTYPNTKESIDNARTKSKNWGYVTDALGAATLISGGVTLYLALSRSGDSSEPKPVKANKTIVLAPTLGGMVLAGSF
jgi:tetratricopeptide (TPR) repeat protein